MSTGVQHEQLPQYTFSTCAREALHEHDYALLHMMLCGAVCKQPTPLPSPSCTAVRTRGHSYRKLSTSRRGPRKTGVRAPRLPSHGTSIHHHTHANKSGCLAPALFGAVHTHFPPCTHTFPRSPVKETTCIEVAPQLGAVEERPSSQQLHERCDFDLHVHACTRASTHAYQATRKLRTNTGMHSESWCTDARLWRPAATQMPKSCPSYY